MAGGALAKIGGKLLTKAAPKALDMGLKQVAGKGGGEVVSHIFKQLGKEGGEKAGKKIFGEAAKQALKGDKGAIDFLKNIGSQILKTPGIAKDATGLALKVAVDSMLGAGGDTVRKMMGLTGNMASALKKTEGALD